jgi:hypothetical protein
MYQFSWGRVHDRVVPYQWSVIYAVHRRNNFDHLCLPHPPDLRFDAQGHALTFSLHFPL